MRMRTIWAAMTGVCPAGLTITGVAGDERGARHAGEDREREVPGGDDDGDAARLVEVDVVLAGDVAHAPRPVEAQHLAPVVLEEVDRLVDVAVGLAPRLAGLEGHEGGELEDLLAHERGGAEEHGGALPRRRVAPGRERRLGRGDGGLGLGTPAVGGRADHLGRPRRVHRRQSLRGVGLATADDERIVRAEPAAHGGERGVVRVAVLACARSRRAAGCRTAPGTPGRSGRSRGGAPARGRSRPRRPARARALRPRRPRRRSGAGTSRWPCSRAGDARGRPCRG